MGARHGGMTESPMNAVGNHASVSGQPQEFPEKSSVGTGFLDGLVRGVSGAVSDTQKSTIKHHPEILTAPDQAPNPAREIGRLDVFNSGE